MHDSQILLPDILHKPFVNQMLLLNKDSVINLSNLFMLNTINEQLVLLCIFLNHFITEDEIFL